MTSLIDNYISDQNAVGSLTNKINKANNEMQSVINKIKLSTQLFREMKNKELQTQ